MCLREWKAPFGMSEQERALELLQAALGQPRAADNWDYWATAVLVRLCDEKLLSLKLSAEQCDRLEAKYRDYCQWQEKQTSSVAASQRALDEIVAYAGSNPAGVPDLILELLENPREELPERPKALGMLAVSLLALGVLMAASGLLGGTPYWQGLAVAGLGLAVTWRATVNKKRWQAGYKDLKIVQDVELGTHWWATRSH